MIKISLKNKNYEKAKKYNKKFADTDKVKFHNDVMISFDFRVITNNLYNFDDVS